MSENKNKLENENLFKKNTKTKGITENVVGEQTIQTSETKILKDSEKEVLIGKSIEKVEKIKADHESFERKLINKMMS